MRIRYPFAGGLAVLLVLSAYAGLAPIETFAVNDKLLHFLDFFLITIALYWSVDIQRRLLFKIVVAASLSLAVTSEVLQAAWPNDRKFDPIDIAANVIGIALAVGLCTWYHKRMLERKRQRKLQGYGLVERDDIEDIELGQSNHEGQELGIIEENNHNHYHNNDDDNDGEGDDDNSGEAWDDLEGEDPLDNENGTK